MAGLAPELRLSHIYDTVDPAASRGFASGHDEATADHPQPGRSLQPRGMAVLKTPNEG